MKKLLLSVISLMVLSVSNAQTVQWSASGGGSQTDETYGVYFLPNGNSIITGAFEGSATFGTATLNSAGGFDGFWAMYDPVGQIVFVVQISGTGNVGGHQIIADNAGNIIVTGEYEGTLTIGGTTLIASGAEDLFIAKYDVGGNPIWARSIGGPYTDEINAVRVDPANNIYTSGFFQGSAAFGPVGISSAGGSDIFVCKMNSNGTFLWTTTAGGPNNDEAHGLAVNNAGAVFVTGYYTGTATFGLNTYSSTNGTKDVFVSYLDPNGYIQWTLEGSGPGNNNAFDAVHDGNGNCLIAGYFDGSIDFGTIVLNSMGDDDIFILKVNSNGYYNWGIRCGGTGEDKAYGIGLSGSKVMATGSFENTMTAGTNTLTSAGDRDVFVIWADTSNFGNVVGGMSMGGPGFDRGYNIVGNYSVKYVTGAFEQTATFGSGTQTSYGATDYFLCKLDVPTLIEDPGYTATFENAYPNPAVDHVFIDLDELTDPSGIVFIFDASGKIVLTKTISNNPQPGIDISHLATGNYTMLFENSELKKNYKIQKL